jgi:hypothetical protein
MGVEIGLLPLLILVVLVIMGCLIAALVSSRRGPRGRE